jgi:hypothetical protein
MRHLLLLSTVACGTLSGARPLEPGRHEVGVVLGGPLVELGGTPIPLPNVVVAGRSGLTRLADRPVDLGYGLNVTGLAFGVVSLQSDLGWLAADQAGARPALTVRNGVVLATNPFGPAKADGARVGVWFVDELEVVASWKAREHVFYASVSQFTDVSAPALTLTPALGTSLDPGEPGGLRFQAELSWFAVNQSRQVRSIGFVPGNPGAFGIHLGFAYGFGKTP